MRNPADLAPTEFASDVPPHPPQADGLNEAGNEATEAIAAGESSVDWALPRASLPGDSAMGEVDGPCGR
jgi:hypothetical protein